MNARVLHLSAILLGIVLVVTACGGAPAQQPAPSGAAAAATAAATPGLESELVVVGFTGVHQAALEKIIPLFEKATGVKVVATYGPAAANVAKVQSGVAVDVVFGNDYDAEASRAQGQVLCLDRKLVPNLKDVYDFVIGPDDCYVATGFQTIAMIYNKDVFKKNNWAAPTSWKDLLDPKFKGRIAGMDIANGYGLYAFLEWAKIEAGEKPQGLVGATASSPKAADAAFKFAQKLKPNVITFCVDVTCNDQLFSSGQAYIGYGGHGRTSGLISQGVPLGIVYPSEGSVASGITLFISKTGKSPRAAQTFINFLLSPDIQQTIVQVSRIAPSNANVKVSADLADLVPTVAALKNFDKTDLNVINASRRAWQERWNSEIAK